MKFKKATAALFQIVLPTIVHLVSPELAVCYQTLLICSGRMLGRLLIAIRHSHKRVKFRSLKRLQLVVRHCCPHRPLRWRRFFHSAWPIRVRLQSDGCVYCSLWVRTTTLVVFCDLPRALQTRTSFQRLTTWLSGGLGYNFDRTRGHPGEGPVENENVRVVCARVSVVFGVCDVY